MRLVGLGLVVSTDGGIPLVSHAYPGNRPDVTQFPEMVNELTARFGAIAQGAGELTLVYDAGQDSKSNQQLIEDSPLHFVGSLPPSDHPDPLAVPKRRYKVVDKARFPGLSELVSGRGEADLQSFGLAVPALLDGTHRQGGSVDGAFELAIRNCWIDAVDDGFILGESRPS